MSGCAGRPPFFCVAGANKAVHRSMGSTLRLRKVADGMAAIRSARYHEWRRSARGPAGDNCIFSGIGHLRRPKPAVSDGVQLLFADHGQLAHIAGLIRFVDDLAADDFFNDIFHTDDAGDATVLVDHHE